MLPLKKIVIFSSFFLLVLLVLEHVAARKDDFRNTFYAANLERHYIILVQFNDFWYIKLVLENISTNVTVLTRSMSMWFSNVKIIHKIHSAHITVQF